MLPQDRASAEPAATPQVGQQILPHHGWGGRPFRIEYDGLHLVGVDRLPVLDYVQHELRNIVLDIDRSKVWRHPAPTLHIDEDPLDFLLFARFLRLRVVTNAARLEQSLAQTLKLLVLWMQRLEIGSRRRRSRNLAQHRLRVAQGRSLIDDRAETCGVNAS